MLPGSSSLGGETKCIFLLPAHVARPENSSTTPSSDERVVMMISEGNPFQKRYVQFLSACLSSILIQYQNISLFLEVILYSCRALIFQRSQVEDFIRFDLWALVSWNRTVGCVAFSTFRYIPSYLMINNRMF